MRVDSRYRPCPSFIVVSRNSKSLLTDAISLIPHTKKWLEYWQCWLDHRVNDAGVEPSVKMPLEAARAHIEAGFNDKDACELMRTS
jgi:hypothetical protein